MSTAQARTVGGAPVYASCHARDVRARASRRSSSTWSSAAGQAQNEYPPATVAYSAPSRPDAELGHWVLEDDGAPAQLGEAHGGAVVVGKLEVRGLLAGLDHADQRMPSPSPGTL